MKHLLTLLAAGVFLAPTVASAQTWLKACQSSTWGTTATTATVAPGSRWCLQWTSSAPADATFEITGETGSACLKSDTGGAGTTAVAEIQWCSPGVAPSDNSCTTLHTLTDGDCESYSDGLYRAANMTAAGGGGEDAELHVEGFGVNP